MSATTMKTGKLETLGEGSRFTYGGIEWVTLDARPNMTLCIAADILKDGDGDARYIPFDEENKNDFAASSLRAYLNGDFLKALVEAGADEEAFAPVVLDLTSDDGLDDYGTDTAKISLISCEMYRRFRKLIPNASDWWWTCTPYTTEKNGNSRIVRLVYSSGALLSSLACFGDSGVRPLCALKSEILVSFDEEQIKPRRQSLGDMISKAILKGLENALINGGDEEPKGIASEEEKREAAPDTEPRKRAEAVDMMKHIAAAFDIPATIDEKSEKESQLQSAKELHGLYTALLEAGFTQPQAWEIFMHNARSAQ